MYKALCPTAPAAPPQRRSIGQVVDALLAGPPGAPPQRAHTRRLSFVLSLKPDRKGAAATSKNKKAQPKKPEAGAGGTSAKKVMSQRQKEALRRRRAAQRTKGPTAVSMWCPPRTKLRRGGPVARGVSAALRTAAPLLRDRHESLIASLPDSSLSEPRAWAALPMLGATIAFRRQAPRPVSLQKAQRRRTSMARAVRKQSAAVRAPSALLRAVRGGTSSAIARGTVVQETATAFHVAVVHRRAVSAGKARNTYRLHRVPKSGDVVVTARGHDVLLGGNTFRCGTNMISRLASSTKLPR